jgi:hypothetical protein
MPTVPDYQGDDTAGTQTSNIPPMPPQLYQAMAFGTLMRRSSEIEDYRNMPQDQIPVAKATPLESDASGSPLAKAAGEEDIYPRMMQDLGKSKLTAAMQGREIMAGRPDPGAPQFFTDAPPGDPSDATWRSIYQQESSSGRDTRTSSTGAIGPGQIMPSTFREFAKPGENIRNFEDNVRVSKRIVKHYHDQYGGDPARVAVAYFSGPGNVAPPGSPTPYKRNSSDGGTTTAQYVNQVTGRLGAGGGSYLDDLGGIVKSTAGVRVDISKFPQSKNIEDRRQAAEPLMGDVSDEVLQHILSGTPASAAGKAFEGIIQNYSKQPPEAQDSVLGKLSDMKARIGEIQDRMSKSRRKR